MIFWNVLLRSPRHFDSFACDSCQFPWSTPHLVKTLEKQKKPVQSSEIYIYVYYIYIYTLYIYIYIYIHPSTVWALWALWALCTEVRSQHSLPEFRMVYTRLTWNMTDAHDTSFLKHQVRRHTQETTSALTKNIKKQHLQKLSYFKLFEIPKPQNLTFFYCWPLALKII